MSEEKRFLDMEKKNWLDMFGNLELPPSINNSLSFPPPPVLLAGAISMAKRLHAKRSAAFEDPEMKSKILKALEVPAIAGAGSLDPNVEAKIVKNLKAVMYDDATGEGLDKELESKVRGFVEFLASGSKTGAGGTTLDLSSKMSARDMELFREQMAIILGGNLPGQGLSTTDLGDDVGFTRMPPTSSILPVAKCLGPPTLDLDIHDKSVETLFFKAVNLGPGMKMKLHFDKSKNKAAFMSSAMLDKTGMLSAFILMDMVSILTESTASKQEANILPEMDTVGVCSQPSTKGKNKDKCCATDVDTMLNYTMAKLGNNLRSASLWVEKGALTVPQEYTITKIHKLPAVNIIGCSKMSFSVAVFYCQHVPKTVMYTVSLIGADGTKLRAPILCHEDTTMWNPNSWIFKYLNCKPSPSTKICHFLAADDIAWMPKAQENTAD